MKIRYYHYLICWVFFLVLQSCMYIPTPQHDLLAGRGMIASEDTQELKIGITTLEDILLQFGEPDLTIERQKIFMYHWTRVRGYFFVGGGYYATGGPIGKTTLLMFEFDPNNLLKRFGYTSEGIFDTTMEAAIKWVSDKNP